MKVYDHTHSNRYEFSGLNDLAVSKNAIFYVNENCITVLLIKDSHILRSYKLPDLMSVILLILITKVKLLCSWHFTVIQF